MQQSMAAHHVQKLLHIENTIDVIQNQVNQSIINQFTSRPLQQPGHYITTTPPNEESIYNDNNPSNKK